MEIQLIKDVSQASHSEKDCRFEALWEVIGERIKFDFQTLTDQKYRIVHQMSAIAIGLLGWAFSRMLNPFNLRTSKRMFLAYKNPEI